jgi:hypothetical protein
VNAAAATAVQAMAVASLLGRDERGMVHTPWGSNGRDPVRTIVFITPAADGKTSPAGGWNRCRRFLDSTLRP